MPRQPRYSIRDEQAVACARIYSAFGALLQAGVSRLRLHYAARMGALALSRKGNVGAAIASLRQEQDAAIAVLRQAIVVEREKAQRAARASIWQRHVVTRRPRPLEMRTRPQRLAPVRPFRAASVVRRPRGPDP